MGVHRNQEILHCVQNDKRFNCRLFFPLILTDNPKVPANPADVKKQNSAETPNPLKGAKFELN